MTITPKSFLFTTWEGGGSIAPVLTVVRRLVARGHRVRMMSDRCNRADAEAAGARFSPWTRAPSRPSRTRETEVLRDWETPGPAGLMQTMDVVWTGPALAHARDLIDELRREPADLVVSSEMLFGVAVGCEAIGQRFCQLAVNVSIFPLPGVPPLGPGLPPARTEADHALHAEIAQANVAMFDHGLPAVNAARHALGLKPLAHTIDQRLAADAFLLATARAFDFAPEVLPPNVRYVGPQLGEPAWAAPWISPWPADDVRPLILAGFSTTFQNHAGVLQRVIDAAADLPVRVLVTLGGSLRADELSPAANTRLVDSAPHDAVMREAAVVVTHGGHGTVCRALCHRRPLLVVPHGRDQNDNAVRVTERGAGLSLAPDAATTDIHNALSQLLHDPGFRNAARRLGDAVAQETSHSPVAEVLEDLAAYASVEEPCPA